jgi:hypothetical protein
VEAAVEEVKAEVKAAPAPAPAVAPAPSSGLGAVSGGASGGRVLPKEEIDPAVLNMLKVRLLKLYLFVYVTLGAPVFLTH